MDMFASESPRRSSPRVSFQDNVSYSSRPSSDSTRPSFGWSKRISSIPEVSDLSEHSSESHHEHVPKRRVPAEEQPRFVFNRFGFGRHRQSSGGVDSGRGSLASVSTRDAAERNSLASRDGGAAEAEAEADITSKLILPSPTSESSSLSRRGSSWIPRLLGRQRKTSFIPHLVVSDYTDISDATSDK
ncbi:hypothetical protein GCK32_003481 [Trichostrongylus colubriformis]|uniref:Uncharacterized protein n=1 Tax=Trichostrongylus colubriformis TaxID=6319 RepID=A0AAN8FRG6_TRICO